jgi:tRNA (adenine22-N1)-methyltransferase
LINRNDANQDNDLNSAIKEKRRGRGLPILSIRLTMVMDLIPPAERLIDIGTDHAYLPIIAVNNGLFREALAVDIRTGPIAIAQKNILRSGCTDKVRTVLSDGLAAIPRQDGDIVVMAGLGGLEMIEILSAAPANWPLLVLQPQKSATQLREYLTLRGYVIRRESLCLDHRRLYLGLLVEYAPNETIDNVTNHYLGPRLRQERPQHYDLYLEKQRIQIVHALKRRKELTALLPVIDALLLQIKIDTEPKNSREEVKC